MIAFPLCLVEAGTILGVFRAPQSFRGSDGTRYPSTAWTIWSDADWTEQLPLAERLPLVEVNPATEFQSGIENDPADWTIGPDAVTATYTVTDLTPEQIAALPGVRAFVQAENELRLRRQAEALAPTDRILFLYEQGLL